MERVEIVQHVDVVTFEQQNLGFRKSAARSAVIDIAADGGDRCDALKRFEDGRIADISKMQDVLNASEFRNHFGTQQAMRVADDADFHRPKLNSSDQRLFDFDLRGCSVDHGVRHLAEIARNVFGSSIAMQ